MGHKKIIALPVLFMAIMDPAFSAVVVNPTLTGLVTGNPPSALDFTFDNRNLTVSISNGTNGAYVLRATATGNFSFYGQSTQPIASAANASYSLVANFNSNNQFVASGSELKITGGLRSTSALPAGVTAPTSTNTTLYDANLTGFGYSTSQGDIAFSTQFLPSWANQSVLTGGSKGESVYLFDQGALLNGGYGRLTELVNAFQNKSLQSVVGHSYTSVQSVASVPLPLPALLFGTGATALVGLARKRRNHI